MYESDIPFLALRALFFNQKIEWFTAYPFDNGQLEELEEDENCLNVYGDLDTPIIVGVIDGWGKGYRNRQMGALATRFIIGKPISMEEAIALDEARPFYNKLGASILFGADVSGYYKRLSGSWKKAKIPGMTYAERKRRANRHADDASNYTSFLPSNDYWKL